MTTAERGSAGSNRTASRFFAEPVRDYVLQRLGQPISVLQAGCLAPLRELALDELAEEGFDVSVTAVDSDQPLARRVLQDTQSAYDDVITGDLRTVPIPQRAYDVVYCALLLERVRHVELVLDRLVSALKPGGLLLVRTGDRYTARAMLDRMLPGPARRAVWGQFRPGIPGPFPPVFEKPVSQDGIAAYALLRGLVIAARGSELSRPAQPAGLFSSVRVGCAAISRLTGGRYDDGHDQLLYVIRKPLDQFARVVLPRPGGITPAHLARAARRRTMLARAARFRPSLARFRPSLARWPPTRCCQAFPPGQGRCEPSRTLADTLAPRADGTGKLVALVAFLCIFGWTPTAGLAFPPGRPGMNQPPFALVAERPPAG